VLIKGKFSKQEGGKGSCLKGQKSQSFCTFIDSQQHEGKREKGEIKQKTAEFL